MQHFNQNAESPSSQSAFVKPFTILSTREENDGSLGVFYSVSYRELASPQVMRTKTMRGYLTMPAGGDVDAFVFDYLKKAGWVE